MAVSAAIALAGLGLAVYGAVQKDKAAKAAKNNKMPEYKIPQEEYDNLRLAEAHANQGISSQSYQAYMNNADRGLANTQSNILKSGGSANDIGQAQDKYQQGMQNLSIYDDQARQQHLGTLMAQNARMGSFGDKRYQMNEYAPWANRAQLYAGQMAGANQTIGQGLGIFAQGAGQFGKSLGGNDDDITKQKVQTTADYGQFPYHSAQNGIGMNSNANSFAGSQKGGLPDYEATGYQPFYSPQVDQGQQQSAWGWNGFMSQQN